ncbi:NTP transferase domain-containing protein [Halomonas sp. MCCC 1A11036]|uniref:NTP transferase domain-containing protein n=1 Tax=Billgrantia zhangzhouensis TaxID=2733481 RepID=A0ABS9AI98_9GAMM|nr:NTP transferase domain-containing protein [Halomonas zhangzhouensis]MCE8021493.1 NTP transferase domain-containing protein [Halomonas zhangzhouensis]
MNLEHVYLEHAQDVLCQWLAWCRAGEVALVVVTATQGGAVRMPGALMAVSATGQRCGYISGGCIDADVVNHARQALRSGRVERLRYGNGSPFIDMPLPCGGAIEICVLPKAEAGILRACHERLASRQPVTLNLLPSGDLWLGHSTVASASSFRYTPKLRLRIAGRGADSLALVRLAMASGIETELQLREDAEAHEARRLGIDNVTQLTLPSTLPALNDDPWTAFLLAFHDVDWEERLLAQALEGPAFYIGAVGSKTTHARRCERLRAVGFTQRQIGRIHGPVGLLPSMREASTLAVSVFAEIVEAYQRKVRCPFASTALVLLAAGQSRRFEEGDKLLARLRGQRVIQRAAAALQGHDLAARIAVVGPDQATRAVELRAAGWTVVVNAQTEKGLSTSLAAGIREAGQCQGVDAALVLLADMPNVPDAHLVDLRDALTPERSAVMSLSGAVHSPPALFDRAVFDSLTGLAGDAGAGQLFQSLAHTATVAIPADWALDVDTREDLMKVQAESDRFAETT